MPSVSGARNGEGRCLTSPTTAQRGGCEEIHKDVTTAGPGLIRLEPTAAERVDLERIPVI